MARARGVKRGIVTRSFYAVMAAMGAAAAQPAFAQATIQSAPGRTDNEIFGPFLGTNIPFQVDRGRNQGVLDRDRPELVPIGLPVRGFTLFPTLTTGIGVSDNIDGATFDRRSSAFFAIDPNVRVTSNWSRHSLSLNAGGAFRLFSARAARDEDNLFANLDGRYDIAEQTNIVGSLRVRRAYEAQFSGTFPANSTRPIQYLATTALVRGQYQTGRLRLTGAVDYNSFQFRNTSDLAGNPIDQSFRERYVYRLATRAEYAVNADAAAFVQASGARTDYLSRIAAFGDNRDGNTFEFLAGATFDLTALIRAQAGIGYVRRSFDSARFGTINGLSYDVRLEYFFTPLTTITATANRSVQDSIVQSSSGFFSNSFRLRVDHELLRNALLFAQGNFQINEFQGLARTDELLDLSGGGRYLLGRNISLGASFSYLDRGSQGAAIGQVFDEYRGVFSVTLQY